MEENSVQLKGTVNRIVFQDKENGYVVFVLYCPEKKDIETVTGICFGLVLDDEVSVSGRYTTHKKYGLQIAADIIQKELPHTAAGLIDYLIANFRGVGPVTARKMVETYGTDLKELFEDENRIAKLKEIGVGEKRAKKICDQYLVNVITMEEKIFYASLKISPSLIAKIREKYKDKAVEVIKENPYQLIDDIDGIGFLKADEIAKKLGFENESSERFRYGIEYLLGKASISGNMFLYENALYAFAYSLLGARKACIQDALKTCIQEGRIIQDEDRFYLPVLYRKECFAASWLLEAAEDNGSLSDKTAYRKIEERVKNLEKEKGKILDECQRDAVVKAVLSNVFILTGGPGTGKTTTLDIIISYLEQYNGHKIALCAPTGRAAKRMSEQTGMDACTIHRLVGMAGWDEDGLPDPDMYIKADTIIVDEMSMVDINIMSMLLKFVEQGTKLIFVGDTDQLPSIGPGCVLKDIIASGIFPVTKLTTIHRQEEGSRIVEYAYLINHGQVPPLRPDNAEFVFISQDDERKAQEKLLNLVVKWAPEHYKIRPSDVQVLAPIKKGDLGVLELNRILQERENPENPEKKEINYHGTIFREGDKVIHTRNNYQLEWETGTETGKGVLNGDVGFIVKIDHEEDTVAVLFDDGHLVLYDEDDLKDLQLAYCLTVHKSQGSEYPVVVIPCVRYSNAVLFNRNLLYTAVTRATKAVFLIGTENTVTQMVKNTNSQKRNSCLAQRLSQTSPAKGASSPEKETSAVAKQ